MREQGVRKGERERSLEARRKRMKAGICYEAGKRNLDYW